MEMVHFIPPSQRRLALMAAQADNAPVLISGGSGTGKGAIARWIHANGPRAAKPLLVATRKEPLPQQIAAAQGSAIVIPEIGQWPLSDQKLLVNLLTTKSIPHPEGGSLKMLINVRVIAITSHSLEGRAQGGLFNPDLLQKLNVFRLEMPALSKRTDEFEDIVLGIMGEITRELHREHIKGLEQKAWDKLAQYDWPGNLRELRNVLRVAIVKAAGEKITQSDLPDFGHDRLNFRATREEFEKIYILELMKTFNWQIDKACKMTRMDKSSLLAKMQKYGIQQPEL